MFKITKIKNIEALKDRKDISLSRSSSRNN